MKYQIALFFLLLAGLGVLFVGGFLHMLNRAEREIDERFRSK